MKKCQTSHTKAIFSIATGNIFARSDTITISIRSDICHPCKIAKCEVFVEEVERLHREAQMSIPPILEQAFKMSSMDTLPEVNSGDGLEINGSCIKGREFIYTSCFKACLC